MRKLTQRLIVLALLTISIITLSWPTTSAAPVDCDLVSRLCHEGNARLYELCVAITGDYTGCALQEAQNNIRCISDNGCGSVPKGPGDN